MAGFLSPNIVYPANGKSFPAEITEATNGRRYPASGVIASLDADISIFHWFWVPRAAPAGILKAQILSTADVAATQNARYRLLWAPFDLTENWGTKALSDESGSDQTIAHATADDYEFNETLVTLDAEALAYGTDVQLLVSLDLKTASWSLAVQWFYTLALIWE